MSFLKKAKTAQKLQPNQNFKSKFLGTHTLRNTNLVNGCSAQCYYCVIIVSVSFSL